jgi:fucose permease
LSAGLAWRWGYALVGLTQMALALLIFARAHDWRAIPKSRQTAESRAVVHKSYRATLRRAIVWVNILLFFSLAGLEVTAGNWAFTLFTEGRGVSVAVAGFWTSFYWASFTAGRLLFGFIADRIDLVKAVRTVMALAVVATALIWWNPANWVGFAGLAVLGFALAPVFPLLTSATPARLGPADATNAIGFQVAAAAFGIAILPGLAGWLAEFTSLEVLGPYMMAIALVMTGLHEISVRGHAE